MPKKSKKTNQEIAEPPEEPSGWERLLKYIFSNYQDFSIIFSGQIRRF